jgi:gas vesicle protein
VSDIAKAETRFFGVLLGAVVALATSIWVRPGLPHERALHEALKHSDRSATVLTDMSEHLLAHQGAVDPQIGQAWVALAEQIMTDLATVRVDAEAALASARWSPLVNRRDAENVLEQIRIAQINARTVYNMANDLFLASKQDRGLDEGIAGSIADVLSATADVISEQGTTARDNPAESLTDTDTTVIDLSSMREDAIDAMKDSDSTQPLLLAGSLLRDAEKISTAVVDGAPKVGGPVRKAKRRRTKRRK